MKRHVAALALLGMCATASTPAWAVRSPTEVGDLVVTEIMTEPQKVAVYFGQWIEVTNASGELLDLNGLVVQDATGAESFTVTGGSELLLPHGEAIVFGVSDVTDTGTTGYNGNIPVDVVYDFGDFEMKRSSDTIRLTYDGDVIDAVTWDSSWGLPTTASHQVAPQGYLEWANGLSLNWCSSDLFIDPTGLYGTPGETNDYCLGAGTDGDGDGYTRQQGDCDDTDPYVHPGAIDGTEAPFGEADDDANCDNVRDNGNADADGDGIDGIDGDCDDTDANINPAKSEGKTADGIDNDCNCWIDDIDGDGDGYPNLDDADYVPYSDDDVTDLFCDSADEIGDCVDEGIIDGVTATQINPGATETPYNGVDEDCDGEDLCDVDGDGYDSDLCPDGKDCDDDNPDVHPGAPDANGEPDGVDNDCDGTIDSPDRDGDGYMVTDGDCDDGNAAVNPGVEEACDDFLDNNCDGFYNEGCSYPAMNASVQGGTVATRCSSVTTAGGLTLSLAALFGLLISRRRR